MEKRLVSRDPFTGRETWCEFTNDDGAEFIFTMNEPVDALLDANKEEANSWRRTSLIGHTQHHRQKIAELPAHLYHALKARFGPPSLNSRDWAKWFNDPDNRGWRTWGGSL